MPDRVGIALDGERDGEEIGSPTTTRGVGRPAAAASQMRGGHGLASGTDTFAFTRNSSPAKATFPLANERPSVPSMT